MARLVTTSAWTALVAVGALAACSSAGDTSAANTTTGAGGETSGSGATTSAATTGAATTGAATTTTSTTTTTVASTTGVGGGPFECDPPADPGSLYELEAPALGAGPISMCAYRGDVVLVVNTAAV